MVFSTLSCSGSLLLALLLPLRMIQLDNKGCFVQSAHMLKVKTG